MWINDISLWLRLGIILHEDPCLIRLQRLFVVLESIFPAESFDCFEKGSLFILFGL